MGQARLKAARREERAALARQRDAGPEAGELPPAPALRPEQIEYWQAQVQALQARLVEVVRNGRPDIQIRVRVNAPGQVTVQFSSGPATQQVLVTSEGARKMAAMIAQGADEADADGAGPPPDLSAPNPGLWIPGA